jgi:hypothetical protein
MTRLQPESDVLGRSRRLRNAHRNDLPVDENVTQY